MKKEESKREEPKKKSGVPLIIIGAVLVAVVIGAIYFTRSGNKATAGNTARTNSPAPNKPSMTIPPNAPAGANPPNYAGAPNAQVVVEEFADYQCSSCAVAHPVLNEIKAMYGSRIKFVFRNYPLTQIHDKAYDAAVIAEAAGLQGKFWDMQNQLFINQKTWMASQNYKQLWNEYAQKIGLDMTKLANDVAGLAAKSRVDADLARAKAIGITGTPTIFVNGQATAALVKTETLKAAIDAEFAKLGAPQANQ
jgi:Na+:H+ antiporter, NhaA family